MSSTCISSNSYYESSRVSNARPEYPKPDAWFLKPGGGGGGGGRGEVKVVDSKSCRRMYVRSAYTFSKPDREEEDDDKERKMGKKGLCGVKDRAYSCYGRGEKITTTSSSYKIKRKDGSNWRKMNGLGIVVTKVKQLSYASVLNMARMMLLCSSKFNEAHH